MIPARTNRPKRSPTKASDQDKKFPGTGRSRWGDGVAGCWSGGVGRGSGERKAGSGEGGSGGRGLLEYWSDGVMGREGSRGRTQRAIEPQGLGAAQPQPRWWRRPRWPPYNGKVAARGRRAGRTRKAPKSPEKDSGQGFGVNPDLQKINDGSFTTETQRTQRTAGGREARPTRAGRINLWRSPIPPTGRCRGRQIPLSRR